MTNRRESRMEDRAADVDEFADDIPTRRFMTRRATTAEITLVRVLYRATTRPGWPRF